MSKKYRSRSHLPSASIVSDHRPIVQDTQLDLEKYDYSTSPRSLSDDEAPLHPRALYSASSTSSSRETSGSHRPMLSEHRDPHRPHSCDKNQHSLSYRPPGRRTIRYLCLALFATLLLFILSLIRASWSEQRQLELGLVDKAPPPPPPWEEFPFLKRYFGGVRRLVSKAENVPEYPNEDEPVEEETEDRVKVNTAHQMKADGTRTFPMSVEFDPYTDDTGAESGSRPTTKRTECFLDVQGAVRVPKVHYYEGVPEGFPDAVMGTHEVLGLRNDICFDRYGRLGPYGYGYSAKRGGTGAGMNGDREGADDMWLNPGKVPEVDYTKVRWHDAQVACQKANAYRFASVAVAEGQDLFLGMDRTGEKIKKREVIREIRVNASSSTNMTAYSSGLMEIEEQEILERTAVVIRTWWDHVYSVDDIVYLRSMIAELSLLSGGEYTVHFLVHVKDNDVPIWADRQIYDRVLENALPEEFRGMGVLWSERQMSLIYGGLEESMFRDLPVHGVYRGHYMPLQYFSNQHPEYDHVWNWEMDVRNTGHWYHLFDRVRQWTKAQPRKGLWERNGRFYVPSVHGNWEDFKQMVRVQSEMGTDSPNNIWSGLKDNSASPTAQGKTDTPVWGPEAPEDVLSAQETPVPPTSADKDRYVWGVGEDADFISFSPLFDPQGTTWFYTSDVTGYNITNGLPPRRATIGTSSRLSKRLLQIMHRETVLAHHHMFSEMWPASMALHHGLKAVYVPHPMYIDRRWPTAYLANVMNGGRNGASGGARTSVYGGREHNFKGTTWFYDAGFAPNFWRRWLGYKVDNDGGEVEEKAGEGRMCVPGMLLHPVKNVEYITEGTQTAEESGEAGETEQDPEIDWEDAV